MLKRKYPYERVCPTCRGCTGVRRQDQVDQRSRDRTAQGMCNDTGAVEEGLMHIRHVVACCECGEVHRTEAFSTGEADSCTHHPESHLITYREYYHLQELDTVRSQRVTALDNILEALGTLLVPPDFHQTSTDSSLFGSQGSEDKPNGIIDPQLSPSATVRENPIHRKSHLNNDRTKWKTLRDFADEAAVEEVLDAVESDRTRIDVSIWHFDCLEIRHWTAFRTSWRLHITTRRH